MTYRRLSGNTKATYDSSAGTLTITNGSQTASLSVSSNFTNATWVLSKDASGGTLVVDPPATSSTTSILDFTPAAQSRACGRGVQSVHGGRPARPKWNIGNDPTLADRRKRATVLGSTPSRMSYSIRHPQPIALNASGPIALEAGLSFPD